MPEASGFLMGEASRRPTVTAMDPALLRERLAAFKVPRFVEFTSEPLPRNAMQKILKKDIRAGFLQRHSAGSA